MHFDQLIHTNQQINTRELFIELNMSLSAVEMTMLPTLEYSKVCTRWVPQIFVQEQKDYAIYVYQELLNQYETEEDSFLDLIITSNETKWHLY